VPSEPCPGITEALTLPQAEPAVDAATAVLLGSQGDGLGWYVSTGTAGDGVAWLAVGGRHDVRADRAPVDGVPELTLDSDMYPDPQAVAVLRWPGTTLAVVDYQTIEVLAFGVGAFEDEDDAAARGVYGTTLATGDTDLDGDAELVGAHDAVRI
jgi:hypothetical protein